MTLGERMLVFVVAVTLAILLAAYLGSLLAIEPTTLVSCFEDQVIVWDGTAHTICVDLSTVKEWE